MVYQKREHGTLHERNTARMRVRKRCNYLPHPVSDVQLREICRPTARPCSEALHLLADRHLLYHLHLLNRNHLYLLYGHLLHLLHG